LAGPGPGLVRRRAVGARAWLPICYGPRRCGAAAARAGSGYGTGAGVPRNRGADAGSGSGSGRCDSAVAVGGWRVRYRLRRSRAQPRTGHHDRVAACASDYRRVRQPGRRPFRRGACGYQAFHYAGTAAQALGQLDDGYAAWLAGSRASVMAGWPARAALPKGPRRVPDDGAGAAHQPRGTAPRRRDRHAARPVRQPLTELARARQPLGGSTTPPLASSGRTALEVARDGRNVLPPGAVNTRPVVRAVTGHLGSCGASCRRQVDRLRRLLAGWLSPFWPPPVWREDDAADQDHSRAVAGYL